MTDKRMSAEKFKEFSENFICFPPTMYKDEIGELLQALKAEREKVEELEEALK